MPPKPSFQAKDLTKILTYLRNRFVTQPNNQTANSQQITSEDNRNSNFSNLQNNSPTSPNFISSIEPIKPVTNFASMHELNQFEHDGFLQRLGINIKDYTPRKNRTTESVQKNIENKLDFNNKISSKQQLEIIDGINSLVQNKSTPPIVKDVLTASANSASFDKISFVATEPPLFALTLAHSADLFSKSEKTAEIHDVNSTTSKEDSLKSIIRTSTYIYQKEMLDNEKTSEIYDNLSLGNAFLRDVLEHSDNEKVREIYSNVLGACYVNSETSDEEHTKAVKALHANVVAEMAINPQETKKNFPNAVEKIEAIHKQYNQKKAENQEIFKFPGMQR